MPNGIGKRIKCMSKMNGCELAKSRRVFRLRVTVLRIAFGIVTCVAESIVFGGVLRELRTHDKEEVKGT